MEGRDAEKERWNEVVEDLWDNLLYFRADAYNDGGFVYDPQTGRYGFQSSEYDSTDELMDALSNEWEDHSSKRDTEESFHINSGNQQPPLHFSRMESGEGGGHPTNEGKWIYLIMQLKIVEL